MNVPVTPVLEHLPRFCRRVGLSEHMAKKLIREGRLEHIIVGNRIHIPNGAFERFVERELALCRVETPAHACATSKSANPGTSSGSSAAASASAALARQIGKRLK
jgi:hypothetical protein